MMEYSIDSYKGENKFKLIAIDLDGTLLKDDSNLSIESKKYFKGNFDGIKVVLISGRMRGSIIEIAKQINVSPIIISHNGAVIENIETNNIIYERSMLKKDVRKLIENYKNHKKISIHFNTDNQVLAYKETEDSAIYCDNLKVKLKINSYEEIINRKIISILFIGEKDLLLHMFDEIKKENENGFSYTFIAGFNGKWMLQIRPNGIDKGIALKKLIKYMDIDSSQVVAIGDNSNDIEMLKTAGLGIAMSNSSMEVKESADYTTKSNNENGVIYALNKIIKGGFKNAYNKNLD